jgi:serpin B
MMSKRSFMSQKSYAILVGFSALIFLVFCKAYVFASNNDDAKAIVQGNNQFAFDLYHRLNKKETGKNIFFSPVSISTVLAMTYAGARGETEKQMATTLHFALDQKRLHPAFSELMKGVESGKGYKLNIANALWGQQGYSFLKDFIGITKTYYGAGFKEVDFKNHTEESRVAINRWVEEKTKDKIKDLIQNGVLTKDTRLVLTNAIYFKGSWLSKFESTDTHSMPFSVTADNTTQVPMMTQTSRFKYMGNGVFQMIEMPYVGNRLSMVILLPKRKDGLKEVEAVLTAKNFDKWLNGLRKEEVDVSIPKFKMTQAFELNETLKSLGMKDAFEPPTLDSGADFSGMTGAKNLSISNVIHEAFIEVNEGGTTAGAATATVVLGVTSISYIPTFKADHPFVFMIRDIKSGAILFVGRIMNPKSI